VLLTDLRGPQPWTDSQSRFEMVSDGDVEPGARVRCRSEDGQELTFVVQTLEPPRGCAFEMVQPSYWGFPFTYHLQPTAAGSRLRCGRRLDLPLYWGLDPRYLRRLAGSAARWTERLQRFKRFVEEEKPDGDMSVSGGAAAVADHASTR